MTDTPPKPNIYLCARYGRRAEMQFHARALEAAGFNVCSTWILGRDAERDRVAGPDEMAVWAAEDMADLIEADAMIAFTEELDTPGCGRGGRHVELGMALANGTAVAIVGPVENVFVALCRQRFGEFRDALEWLKGAFEAESWFEWHDRLCMTDRTDDGDGAEEESAR